MKPYITRTILILSLVSLLTDMASEMLYPIMPAYLQSIGYGVIAIGMLEGFAEAFAGISKIFFGRLSDATDRKKPFIIIGYALSAVAKPFIGFTSSLAAIFGAKFADRLGKGIRTAPRDALLVSESAEINRGKVFGLHRSLDTLGAVLGPLIGLAYIIYHPGDWRGLFILAIVPGALAIGATLLLPKEKGRAAVTADDKSPAKNLAQKIGLKSIMAFWKQSSTQYKKLFFGFVLMSLINGTNMFLLLRAGELGFSPVIVIIAYLAFNIAFAGISFPMGAWADKRGFKPVYIAGLLAFAATYGILGYGLPSAAPALLILVFIIYGIFGAAEDGMAKAWLSLHIPKDQKATGIGFYLLFNSLSLLIASVGTAFLWKAAGGAVALSTISVLSLVVIGYFSLLSNNQDIKKSI